MSKFLDSRFNKISYLTPPLFLHLISPQKLTFLGVESEGRFRRVASHVLVSKTLAALRGFRTGLMARSSMRARVSLAPPPPAGGQGAAPSGARFAPLRWSSPSRWAGSGCVSVKGALRPSSQSSLCRPAGCAWLRVAPGGP